jgi:hypothetical protein
MDYDKTNAESILHVKGRVAVVVHSTFLDRDEKDVLRAAIADSSSGVVQLGKNFYGLLIDEEPDSDELALAAYEEFEADQAKEPVMPPNTPTIPDELDGLTVAQLKDLADQEEIDISDVKLKADIVGRIWGAREMRAEQEG